MTTACRKNNITTENGYEYYYPYKQVEEDLKAAGYDVIVFVPSLVEDESRITCGNAILSNMNQT
jgi:23S rRNA (adenine2503-C2)-methyltransferase